MTNPEITKNRSTPCPSLPDWRQLGVSIGLSGLDGEEMTEENSGRGEARRTWIDFSCAMEASLNKGTYRDVFYEFNAVRK